MMQRVYSEENGTHLEDFYNCELAQLVGLEHHWSRQEDYWVIGINWTVDSGEPLMLYGCTDHGPELEGEFINDVWTVTFTIANAYFAVGWCDAEGCRYYWCGYLEFTVTIQKMPST